MAITRTQIARQLYKKGTGLGGAGSKGRQDAESQYGGGSYDSSSNQSGREQSFGIGRDPSKSGEGANVRPTNIFDEVALTSSTNPNFIQDARRAVTPLGDRLLGNLPFSGGLFVNLIRGGLNAFSPSPFGYSTPTAVDMSGDTGGGGVPYWAQLGFNSEAEYLAALAAQGTSTTEPEPEEEEVRDIRKLAFRAEGGPIGGEYDFETARQAYGLGKLVKKIGRSVKKIAKSPIGKAALIGAIGFGIPGTSIGGLFGRASFGGAATGLFGKQGIAATLAGLKGTAATKAIGVDKFGNTIYSRAAPSLFSSIPGGGVTAAIAGTSLLAGLLTPEQEQEAQELSRGEGIDIDEARKSILNAGTAQDFRAVRFRAEGGSTEEKEPVAKKTMPLIDMGGKEKDYRETGGFVDMGRMEKADDVPARLSKNEFVFTADAVRNAGDGSVDKGAEVMYNMMKNLEAGGEVSEESQGLEGARKMFQTSQRLEEVL